MLISSSAWSHSPKMWCNHVVSFTIVYSKSGLSHLQSSEVDPSLFWNLMYGWSTLCFSLYSVLLMGLQNVVYEITVFSPLIPFWEFLPWPIKWHSHSLFHICSIFYDRKKCIILAYLLLTFSFPLMILTDSKESVQVSWLAGLQQHGNKAKCSCDGDFGIFSIWDCGTGKGVYWLNPGWTKLINYSGMSFSLRWLSWASSEVCSHYGR